MSKHLIAFFSLALLCITVSIFARTSHPQVLPACCEAPYPLSIWDRIINDAEAHSHRFRPPPRIDSEGNFHPDPNEKELVQASDIAFNQAILKKLTEQKWLDLSAIAALSDEDLCTGSCSSNRNFRNIINSAIALKTAQDNSGQFISSIFNDVMAAIAAMGGCIAAWYALRSFHITKWVQRHEKGNSKPAH